MRTIARHHVLADERQLKQLGAFCKSLKPRSHGMTPKNRECLRQFDDPQFVAALMRLPGEMFAEAMKCVSPTKGEALIAQTAVAIEILLTAPIRIKNLGQLTVGETLVFGRNDNAHIVVGWEEVKNETDLEMPLPEPTVRMIRTYLARFHPLLAQESTAWLFPGEGDRPKALATLSRQIVKAAGVRCGLQINVHIFRHIAAKLCLEANPGAYGVIKLLLGHESIETTMGFYCGTESAATTGSSWTCARPGRVPLVIRHDGRCETIPRRGQDRHAVRGVAEDGSGSLGAAPPWPTTPSAAWRRRMQPGSAGFWTTIRISWRVSRRRAPRRPRWRRS